MNLRSRQLVFALCMLLVCNGCIVGPDYVQPDPIVPADWQNLAVPPSDGEYFGGATSGAIVSDDTLQQGVYTLSAEQCPWWTEFLDENMIQMIELQRAQSPTLHEFRAAVDQAWHQRWVLKRGAYPHSVSLHEHQQTFQGPEMLRSGSRSHNNIWRADIGWELDVFGGIQRSVEVADRELESQVENWRNGVLFFTSEIGLFYTDYRVAEQRIELQKQNIEFYEYVVGLVAEKLKLGGVAAIDLEESKAQLQRIKSLLPQLERTRDNARVELARVTGVYSQQLDEILTPNLGIPSPGELVAIPKPAIVLPQRPDIRRLERKIAAQVARVSFEYKDLYPMITAPQVIDLSDTVIPIFAHYGIGITATFFKRIIHPERERAKIREEEAILQREIRNYERRMVEAASEVENAIVDAQSAYQQIHAIEAAVRSNHAAFEAVFSAYRGGLVDVRDIIRISNALIDSRTELIFAKNLLSKSTIRLFKAIGGVDLPNVPAYMVPSRYDVTDTTGGNKVMSRLLSIFRDQEDSLKTNRNEIRHRNKGLYYITLDGELRLTPEKETELQRRLRDQ